MKMIEDAPVDMLEMKQCLRKWGRVNQVCNEYQDSIRKIDNFLKKLEGLSAKHEIDYLRSIYTDKIKYLTDKIIELQKFSDEMEKRIDGMEAEDAMLIRLKYDKSATTESICIRLHISRSTFYRKQDKCIRWLMNHW